MKSTGIIRELDGVNRLVLPHEALSVLDLDPKGVIEVFTDKGIVILKKAYPTCTFCGSMEDLTKFKDKYICNVCSQETKTL